MKMFGDPSSFAIETMIEPDLIAPSTAWGRMRLWCEGFPLGDIEEEYCGLDQSFDHLCEIANNFDAYWNDEFNTFSSIEVIDFLDAILFGCCGDQELEDVRSFEQVEADARSYGRFSFLTNWGEQFDRVCKPFILCPPTGAVHIISRGFDPKFEYSLTTTREAFSVAVIQANRWFQEQKNALRGSA